MFALVIGITQKNCPAVPVKHVELTQRTLCGPMDYINHGVRSMKNKKRNNQFQ